jgi:uncharacterized membrane protein YedE/YeeE
MQILGLFRASLPIFLGEYGSCPYFRRIEQRDPTVLGSFIFGLWGRLLHLPTSSKGVRPFWIIAAA